MHCEKLFLVICLSALCCLSCSKPEDNQGVNQGQNQGGNQGGNPVTGQNETPYQLTSSYVYTQTSYLTNPPTETTTRSDFSYDSQNRVISIRYSTNGVVTSENKNYVWGDKKSSYDTFSYNGDGSISVKGHHEYTYK